MKQQCHVYCVLFKSFRLNILHLCSNVNICNIFCNSLVYFVLLFYFFMTVCYFMRLILCETGDWRFGVNLENGVEAVFFLIGTIIQQIALVLFQRHLKVMWFTPMYNVFYFESWFLSPVVRDWLSASVYEKEKNSFSYSKQDVYFSAQQQKDVLSSPHLLNRCDWFHQVKWGCFTLHISTCVLLWDGKKPSIRSKLLRGAELRGGQELIWWRHQVMLCFYESTSLLGFPHVSFWAASLISDIVKWNTVCNVKALDYQERVSVPLPSRSFVLLQREEGGSSLSHFCVVAPPL